MYRFFFNMGVWFLSLFSAPLSAEPVLAEIFTSENCYICAGAEAELAKLAENPDVIAIAYHIEYWDYLGEQDPFGNPVFTSRQLGYNQDSELKTLPTPQLFIDGRRFDGGPLEASLQQTPLATDASPEKNLIASVNQSEDGFEIRFEALENPGSEIDIVLVDLVDADVAEMKLADRYQGNIYVVKSLTALAKWDGEEALDVLISSRDEHKPMVIFAQSEPFGDILFVEELITPK